MDDPVWNYPQVKNGPLVTVSTMPEANSTSKIVTSRVEFTAATDRSQFHHLRPLFRKARPFREWKHILNDPAFQNSGLKIRVDDRGVTRERRSTSRTRPATGSWTGGRPSLTRTPYFFRVRSVVKYVLSLFCVLNLLLYQLFGLVKIVCPNTRSASNLKPK